MTVIDLRCPCCGGDIHIPKDLSDFYCSYCGTKLTVQDMVNDKNHTASSRSAAINGLLRKADTLVSLGEHGRAESVYREIISTYPEDWRGWWGIAVNDMRAEEAIFQSCHCNNNYGFDEIETGFARKNITDNSYFKHAYALANEQERHVIIARVELYQSVRQQLQAETNDNLRRLENGDFSILNHAAEISTSNGECGFHYMEIIAGRLCDVLYYSRELAEVQYKDGCLSVSGTAYTPANWSGRIVILTPQKMILEINKSMQMFIFVENTPPEIYEFLAKINVWEKGRGKS